MSNKDANHITVPVILLYTSVFGCQPQEIIPITGSGSNRKYFRLLNNNESVIGVFNPDRRENQAFIYLSKHFLSKGLPVADIIAEDINNNVYILEDLGNISLYDLVSQRIESGLSEELLTLYKKSIDRLIEFQIRGISDLDTTYCYPRSSFDRQSVLWDLNYFKYYFAKLVNTEFDEQLIENDFNLFADILIETDTQYFMYRDFQSRNIMIKDNEPYFIDFQGGRKGALQYDLASLLYQAKAKINPEDREELLSYYISKLNGYIDFDESKFRRVYNAYVLIRVLQVLGAYGYRGYFERKTYFIESIPPAIINLKDHILKCEFLKSLPELHKVISQIIANPSFNPVTKPDILEVVISSFSYKKGIPNDNSGNGGGYVFDCRALPNPGRLIEYKTKTGMDNEVMEYFSDKEEMHIFLKNVYSIVDQSVETYINRGFTNLMVNFGCTGGQHRSVFAAENLATHLIEKFNVNIKLNHIEQEIYKTLNKSD